MGMVRRLLSPISSAARVRELEKPRARTMKRATLPDSCRRPAGLRRGPQPRRGLVLRVGGRCPRGDVLAADTRAAALVGGLGAAGRQRRAAVHLADGRAGADLRDHHRCPSRGPVHGHTRVQGGRARLRPGDRAGSRVDRPSPVGPGGLRPRGLAAARTPGRAVVDRGPGAHQLRRPGSDRPRQSRLFG